MGDFISKTNTCQIIMNIFGICSIPLMVKILSLSTLYALVIPLLTYTFIGWFPLLVFWYYNLLLTFSVCLFYSIFSLQLIVPNNAYFLDLVPHYLLRVLVLCVLKFSFLAFVFMFLVITYLKDIPKCDCPYNTFLFISIACNLFLNLDLKSTLNPVFLMILATNVLFKGYYGSSIYDFNIFIKFPLM